MSIFGGGSPPSVPMPPAAKSTEQAAENAANSERLRLLRAMGRQSTMIAGQNQSQGGQKTLLAG